MKNRYRIIFLFLLSSFLACVPEAKGQDNPENSWKPLLDKLAGSWELTATMGSRELHQRCEADWILQSNFFEMDCRAVPPDTSGYMSKYVIGYHTEKGKYLFHLFDTYGGNYSEILGRGEREGNKITYEFRYEAGPFRNEFIYDEKADSWRMVLRQQSGIGEWELFAEKRLRRIE